MPPHLHRAHQLLRPATRSLHQSPAGRSWTNAWPTNPTELAKAAAGYAAVESCLEAGHTRIGIGSGSTVVAVVDALAQDVERHRHRS